MIQSHLQPEDRYARISSSQILLVIPLNSQAAVRKKMSALQKKIIRFCGSSFVLNCGFAEVMNSNIIDAIDAVGQILHWPHPDNVIIGISFPRLQNFGE